MTMSNWKSSVGSRIIYHVMQLNLKRCVCTIHTHDICIYLLTFKSGSLLFVLSIPSVHSHPPTCGLRGRSMDWIWVSTNPDYLAGNLHSSRSKPNKWMQNFTWAKERLYAKWHRHSSSGIMNQSMGWQMRPERCFLMLVKPTEEAIYIFYMPQSFIPPLPIHSPTLHHSTHSIPTHPQCPPPKPPSSKSSSASSSSSSSSPSPSSSTTPSNRPPHNPIHAPTLLPHHPPTPRAVTVATPTAPPTPVQDAVSAVGVTGCVFPETLRARTMAGTAIPMSIVGIANGDVSTLREPTRGGIGLYPTHRRVALRWLCSHLGFGQGVGIRTIHQGRCRKRRKNRNRPLNQNPNQNPNPNPNLQHLHPCHYHPLR